MKSPRCAKCGERRTYDTGCHSYVSPPLRRSHDDYGGDALTDFARVRDGLLPLAATHEDDYSEESGA